MLKVYGSMEKESQRLLESVRKLIAAQFGPDCEVVLHDWSKEYESTIVAIENGHVSGRKVGDGGSNLGLEVMRGTTDGSNQLNYITADAGWPDASFLFPLSDG